MNIMSKLTKTLLTFFLGAIALGIAFIGVSFMLNINRNEPQTITCDLAEPFTNLFIDVNAESISIMPTAGETGHVTYEETDKITYSIQNKNGALHIVVQDNRSWFDYVGIHFTHRKIELYLPQIAYESLSVTTSSGDITCEEGLSFTNVKLSSTSGKIDFRSTASDKVTANSTSGSIAIANFHNAQIKAESTSGKIICENGDAEFVTLRSTSGSVKLENVLASESINIETTSGSISLDGCDGESLILKSTSGSVRGTLLSEKNFQATSNSGSIHVPTSNTSAGICKISTTSGSIHMEIEK